MQCVFFEERTEHLNIIYMSFNHRQVTYSGVCNLRFFLKQQTFRTSAGFFQLWEQPLGDSCCA